MWKSVLQGAAEQRHVTRRGLLPLVGQTGRVAECRAFHADGAGRARHPLSEGGDRSGNVLGDDDGDVIGGFDGQCTDGRLHRNRPAGAKSELGRRLGGGFFGDFQAGLTAEAAALQFLKQDIERHHLGQRGRITRRVGAAGIKRLAAFGVDDDAGIFGVGEGRLRRGRNDDGGQRHKTGERDDMPPRSG